MCPCPVVPSEGDQEDSRHEVQRQNVESSNYTNAEENIPTFQFQCGCLLQPGRSGVLGLDMSGHACTLNIHKAHDLSVWLLCVLVTDKEHMHSCRHMHRCNDRWVLHMQHVCLCMWDTAAWLQESVCVPIAMLEVRWGSTSLKVCSCTQSDTHTLTSCFPLPLPFDLCTFYPS